MQEFNFPSDLDLNTFLIFLIPFLIFVVAACWLNGYFFEAKDPYGREDRLVGAKRANLWAKVAGGLVCTIVLLTWLGWENCFYRLDLSPDGYLKIWRNNPRTEIITMNKTEIDSIHYGLRKGSLDCYVRIQLKDGTVYKSTFGNQCKSAYESLTKFVGSQ